MQFSASISDHDIEHKVKQVNKFLDQKNDVNMVMKIYGEARRHVGLAEEKMQHIIGLCAEHGTVHDTKKHGYAHHPRQHIFRSLDPQRYLRASRQ